MLILFSFLFSYARMIKANNRYQSYESQSHLINMNAMLYPISPTQRLGQMEQPMFIMHGRKHVFKDFAFEARQSFCNNYIFSFQIRENFGVYYMWYLDQIVEYQRYGCGIYDHTHNIWGPLGQPNVLLSIGCHGFWVILNQLEPKGSFRSLRFVVWLMT